MSARRVIVLAVVVGALAAPVSADAATISVRQDGVADAVPVAGLVTRDPNPDVVVGFTGGEASFALAVLGPGGETAAVAVDCAEGGGEATRRVSFTGNGAYQVVLRTYPFVNCAGSARERRESFSIDARDAIVPPPGGVLLLRPPYSYSYNDHRLALDLAAGATSHEVVYARNATLGPDGAIAGATEPASIIDGKAELILSDPGIYTVVARPSGIGVNGSSVPAPWSAPLRLAVLAPFDLERTEYLDSRGPSYRVRLVVRERSASGRVAVTAARGARGRRFRSLGTARLRRGELVKRFRLTRRGAYRLRFTFAGSATVAPGTITLPISIR